MGEIREINHTYRIAPRTEHAISVPKGSSREQSEKEKREHPHDEIEITHRIEGITPAEETSDSKLDEHPGEIPGLDISA